MFKNKKGTFVIAELSSNHEQSFDLAIKTIDAIKESGADAVKFQTYKPESLTLNITNEFFKPRCKGLWKGIHPYDLYKKAATPYEWHPKMVEHARSIDLEWLSSPFDFEAVDFLETLDIQAYKIASLEILDIPLIKYVAEKQKPVIISTGIAKLSDIELAIETCKNVGNEEITILKCTSAYPTPYEEVNLNVIPSIAKMFGVSVGLSDHTLGVSVPLGAVALGAKVIEKHFTLNRQMGGVDAAFSLEPDEFKDLIINIRNLEASLGMSELKLSSEMEEIRKRGRSLFVVKNIKKGEQLTADNIKSLRPGDGIHPKYYYSILYKKARKDLPKGTPLDMADIDFY